VIYAHRTLPASQTLSSAGTPHEIEVEGVAAAAEGDAGVLWLPWPKWWITEPDLLSSRDVVMSSTHELVTGVGA
jgi:hypothetical protein